MAESVSEITLRTCSRDDVDAVLALWKRSGVAGSLIDTADELLTRLDRDAELFVVAETDGKIGGTLIGGWDGWRGNMYRLVVDRDCRRRGIARALVREVESRLVLKGARRVTALVLREEDGASAFWSAVGSRFTATSAICRPHESLGRVWPTAPRRSPTREPRKSKAASGKTEWVMTQRASSRFGSRPQAPSSNRSEPALRSQSSQ
jgi:ribosomal protein S18 acetylase RimI-like enzyme